MAIADRMIRAARGEVALFEEVEHDQAATTEAMTVVAIIAVAGGIGGAIGQLLSGHAAQAILGLAIGIASTLIGWAVFSGVTYFIGTQLFHGEATWGEVLRTLAYAYTPLILGVLSWIPILGGILVLAAFFWTIYLSFVAIRSALDIDSGKTILAIVLSIIPSIIIAGVINLPLMATMPRAMP